MDNVCNRCLFSIPSKVEMAEEQEYLRCNDVFVTSQLTLAKICLKDLNQDTKRYQNAPAVHIICWQRISNGLQLVNPWVFFTFSL